MEVASTMPSGDRLSRLLAAVPALCFVHCVGSVGLALALPAAASLWSSSDWLEGPLWLVSLVVVGVMLLRRKMTRSASAAMFMLALSAGGLGFIQDVELAKRVSLLLLVGIQVISWRQQRSLVAARVCACHGHRLAA